MGEEVPGGNVLVMPRVPAQSMSWSVCECRPRDDASPEGTCGGAGPSKPVGYTVVIETGAEAIKVGVAGAQVVVD